MGPFQNKNTFNSIKPSTCVFTLIENVSQITSNDVKGPEYS